MSAEPAILPILLPQDPGPAPEPPATGPVPPSRWRALWVRLVGVLRPGWRDRTPLEVQLTHEVARLRYRLWEVENQVFGLKHALSVKDSELRIQAREIALLSDLHERDRLRLEKDGALYAHAIALAAPRDPTQGR